MGMLIAPLFREYNKCPPPVFGKPYTKEELEALVKEWEPLLNMVQESIVVQGHRPENFPAQDTTVLISRILASLGVWKPKA